MYMCVRVHMYYIDDTGLVTAVYSLIHLFVTVEHLFLFDLHIFLYFRNIKYITYASAILETHTFLYLFVIYRTLIRILINIIVILIINLLYKYLCRAHTFLHTYIHNNIYIYSILINKIKKIIFYSTIISYALNIYDTRYY